jgi:hypothetical protein
MTKTGKETVTGKRTERNQMEKTTRTPQDIHIQIPRVTQTTVREGFETFPVYAQMTMPAVEIWTFPLGSDTQASPTYVDHHHRVA